LLPTLLDESRDDFLGRSVSLLHFFARVSMLQDLLDLVDRQRRRRSIGKRRARKMKRQSFAKPNRHMARRVRFQEQVIELVPQRGFED
jgi:hypothetical protein